MSDEIRQAWDLCFELIAKHKEFIINNFIDQDELDRNICGNILAGHALCSNIVIPYSVYVHAIDIMSSVEFQFFMKDYFTIYDHSYSIINGKFARIHMKTLSLNPKSNPHKHIILDIYIFANDNVMLGLRGKFYVAKPLRNLRTLGELLLKLYEINSQRRI